LQEGLIQYAILLPILYLGIVTSIDDYKFGKIYHHHIKLGIAVGVGWYAMLVVLYGFFLWDWSVATEIVPRVVASTLIAFVISATMWWFNVWSAADAKLFTVFTLLMPMSVYRSGGTDVLSSMILMVNAYTVAFVVITGDFLIRLGKRIQIQLSRLKESDGGGRSEIAKEYTSYLSANWFSWVKTFMGFALLLVMVRIVRNIARGELEGILAIDDRLMFLALFLAFRPLHKLFQIKAVAYVVVLLLAGFIAYLLVIDPSGEQASAMASVGLWALGLITFRQIYTYWSKLVEVTMINIEDLGEHMIISQKTQSNLVGQGVFSSEEMKELGVEGLSEEWVTRIKHLYKDEDGEACKEIEIEKTIAFAPYIFAGLIATFFVHGILIKIG